MEIAKVSQKYNFKNKVSVDDLLIAIIFYNGDTTIVQNVKLLSKVYKNILIVNNGSNSDSQDILIEMEEINEITVINNKDNKGIGYALNQALKIANKMEKKYLLTLDQDTIISNECIYCLLDKLINSVAVSVGPFYVKRKNEDKFVKYLITSGNMIEVDVAIKVGGFANELFIDCVDIDFSFKLLVNGYKMLQVGGAFMEHRIGEVQKDSPIGLSYYGHSAKRYYYNYRNNVYVYRKYFNILPAQCIKLFLSLLRQFLIILLIEGDKMNKINYCIKGVISGLNMKVSCIERTRK